MDRKQASRTFQVFRTQFYAWSHLCSCTRWIEIPNALWAFWWWRMLTLPCNILITNPSFAVIARYGSRQFWAFWFGSMAIYGLVMSLTGPPIARAIGLLGGMWLWTLVAVHLVQASPWCGSWPLNTGAGIYAIDAGACCAALSVLFRMIFADIFAAWYRLRQRKQRAARVLP